MMIVVSSLAIAAYSCKFENAMERNPVTYMMSLLYFRGPECSKSINWHSLGVSLTSLETVNMPDVSAASLRTFTLAVLYLTTNIFLVITSILLLCMCQCSQGWRTHFSRLKFCSLTEKDSF